MMHNIYVQKQEVQRLYVNSESKVWCMTHVKLVHRNQILKDIVHILIGFGQ